MSEPPFLAEIMRQSRVPPGFKLAARGADSVEVWTSDHEIVVLASPRHDDESHNCDALGCSTFWHVLYRETRP